MPGAGQKKLVLIGCAAILLGASATLGGAAGDGGDPLRVCSDPNNLPFSNQDGAGFENKLADLIAEPDTTRARGDSDLVDVLGSAYAATDGDPTTAWTAPQRVVQHKTPPTLSLTLPQPTEVHGLRLVPSRSSVPAHPTMVAVDLGRPSRNRLGDYARVAGVGVINDGHNGHPGITFLGSFSDNCRQGRYQNPRIVCHNRISWSRPVKL